MKTLNSLINSQQFRFCAMAVHGVGMVNATFRLWFFCMLLIATMDLSHESFKHWNALNCVIRGPSLFVKTFARSFRGNTKAYWIVLSSNIKPYILRSSLMVNLEFWIPLAAPPFPFSFCICWVYCWLVGGGGGGGVGSFRGYLLLWWGLHVLTHYMPKRMSGNISFCGVSETSEISSVCARRTRTCDV